MAREGVVIHPSDGFVHHLVARHAQGRPNDLAVCASGRTIVYGELDRRAAELAAELRGHAARPDNVVAVCLPRGLELAVAQLAVLKSGAAYLPLDGQEPPARIGLMCSDARVRAMITTRSLAYRVPRGVRSIDVDQVTSSSTPSGGDTPVDKEHIAYVIYTSGTSGRPKGVMITHGSLSHFVGARARSLDLGPADRISLFASPAFDVSVMEMWSALAHGASLHVPHDDLRVCPRELQAWLIAERITIAHLPTAVAEAVFRLEWPARPALRLLITGGDRLTTYPPAGLPFAVLNEYGPTEATILATSGRVVASGECAAPPGIGREWGDAMAHLLDSDLRGVHVGLGELFLAGPGLARGYLGRPDLTAERFVPDPASGLAGSRMFRTCDLVRRGAGGDLEFLARVDDQLKIRGHRIEPAHIALALQTHPLVATSHVSAHTRPEPVGKQLVAYVVPRDVRRIPSAAQLRTHLAEHLLPFMIPQVFVLLEQMPMNKSGKVDRTRLSSPDSGGEAETATYVAPQSEIERMVAGIWQEVLRRQRVGMDDCFLTLGGNSLLAAQVAARFRERTGSEVPLRLVFAHTRLCDFVRAIQALATGSRPPALPPIRPRSASSPSPLSVAQEQVWFLEKLQPKTLAYQSQTTLRILGPLNVDVLARAITEIVRRHEILRTTYHEVDGRPVQVVHAPEPVHLTAIDLSHLEGDKRAARAEEIVAAELHIPFALDELPLARWTVLHLEPEEHELILVEHHLVHDGWSFAVLMHELGELYTAYARGDRPALLDLPVQYADYASWQRTAIESGIFRAQREFWRAQLHGVPQVLALPTDRPRPRAQSFRGGRLRFDLPSGLPAVLRSLARSEGVTLFSVMLAGFAALLHRYCGETDFCLGSGFANRRSKETEGLIGMFVNTVVLRCQVAGHTSFRELTRRAQETIIDSQENQEYPFPLLVDALAAERDPSRNPLVQVLFSFHDSAFRSPLLAGTPTTIFERGNQTAKMDLNIIVIPRMSTSAGSEAVDGRMTVLWEYAAELFDEETMRRMAGHYVRLLEEAALAPQTAVGDLPILSERERHDSLFRWNATAVPMPTAAIHELFRVQVTRKADAVALRFAGQTVTYAELDRRSDELADRLLGLGLRPGEIAAVCLERSPEMIVSLLGILKAGGAYLPLDPRDPAERMSTILADAEVSIVLSHAPVVDRLPASSQAAIRIVLVDDSGAHSAPGGRTDSVSGRRSCPPFRSPWQLACVMYTSGSTGKPKCVCIPHRALVRLVMGSRYADSGPAEVFLQLSPLSFDASAFEIWGSLLNGGQLVLMPPGLPSLGQLSGELTTHGVTTLFLTTALFEQMVLSEPARLAGVRQLLVGGEIISPARVLEHQERAGRMTHVYGPTEMGTFTTFQRLVAPVDAKHPSVPIGLPISNTTVYVLDERLQPVPVGVTGELYAGGEGQAWGYLKRPGLTAERFLPDPFAADGQRMYRTGDRARRRRDGAIEFLGRSDQQVKIRGFRIEPEEVEAALAHLPEVRKAAVRVAGEGARHKRLIAHVVLTDRTAFDASRLRQSLMARLPEYMIPSQLIPVEAIPLTPNGKVDRASLPLPASLASGPPRELPARNLERRIAAMWAEILQVDEVGLDETFFELGGNSILLVQVHHRLVRDVGRLFPLMALFEHGTVRAQSAFLQAMAVDLPVGERAGSERRRLRDKQLERRRALCRPASESDDELS